MIRRRLEKTSRLAGKTGRPSSSCRPALNATVVCPTPQEYAACRAALGLEKERRLGGRLVAGREEPGLSLQVVKAWPGKASCASAVQLLIDLFRPHLIIDTGASGALDPELEPGTIVCVERAYEYDIVPLDVFPSRAAALTTATAVAGASAQAKKAKKMMRDFMKKAGIILPGPPLLFGDIASGEKDVADAAFRDRLRAVFQASACDWETASVLRTAARNGVPALSFRVITDRADKNLETDYRRNVAPALERLGLILALFFEEKNPLLSLCG